MSWRFFTPLGNFCWFSNGYVAVNPSSTDCIENEIDYLIAKVYHGKFANIIPLYVLTGRHNYSCANNGKYDKNRILDGIYVCKYRVNLKLFMIILLVKKFGNIEEIKNMVEYFFGEELIKPP